MEVTFPSSSMLPFLILAAVVGGSLIFWFITTLMTFRYLGRHYVHAKFTFLPFGFLNIYHFGFLYFFGVVLLSVASFLGYFFITSSAG